MSKATERRAQASVSFESAMRLLLFISLPILFLA
jgi:hypothetical protein